MIDTGNVKYGFWVAIGVLLAIAIWGFLRHLASKARNG